MVAAPPIPVGIYERRLMTRSAADMDSILATSIVKATDEDEIEEIEELEEV
jgi:hypothetical protein